jgi:hypothetical protein
MAFTPPASFQEKIRLPTFPELSRSLVTAAGREFEEAVHKAFNFLDFDASLTHSTQAESDVIAEAYYAERPYFIVVECQAVRPENQIGYEKVGQIRGNAETYYLDTRRQRLFQTLHKLIVGRPAFSADARSRSLPDVGLMTSVTLLQLLMHHKQLCYSQDELKEIFEIAGEISTSHVVAFRQRILARRQHERKLQIYSLIYLAMLDDPFSDNFERRRHWVTSDIVIGSAQIYGRIFGLPNLSEQEVRDAMRDLDNPFINILKRRLNSQNQQEVRLSTTSRAMIYASSEFGKMLSLKINADIIRLRTLSRGRPPASINSTPR